jgi:pimeloyl-ACP methyl ester carboxylesterase
LGRSLGGAVAITAARRSRIKSLALWAPVFTSQPWKELWQSVQKNQHVDISKEDILRHLPISVPNIDFLTQFFKMDLEKELNGISHVPLLHIQGMQDLTVKEEHAKGFEEVRKGVQNTRFIQLPKSDHEFSCPQEQAVAIQETCSWYQNTL